ncbi:hypothetical protein CYMTET_48953 [Cymbomonas tetramitiformis]|uniref:Plastid lipid-associated protein/fibrillin conserved domain-containing protein n=1 Tax=Cymbomonas tetramitiformis TaxID=36881 RepID=A0AAE0BSU5_9CHLO|nr:hypothetical protein CYMTET_48953 [Cymbomonas tetramitiformis]
MKSIAQQKGGSFRFFASQRGGKQIGRTRVASNISCSALEKFLKPFQSENASTKSQAKKLKASLREAIKGTSRGVIDLGNNEDILAIVDSLEKLQGTVPTTESGLDSAWKLLWTTEKETCFLLQKGIFGVGPAGESYQVIDVENGSLQNIIEFGKQEEKDSVFQVDSSLSVTSERRCTFKFRAAALQTPSFRIPFPPVGQGWFDTVYMDEEIRCAKDVRGDVLIVERTDLPLDTFRA